MNSMFTYTAVIFNKGQFFFKVYIVMNPLAFVFVKTKMGNKEIKSLKKKFFTIFGQI